MPRLRILSIFGGILVKIEIEYMKQTIFKIMLLLAVIFMRVEMAGAVSCNHEFHDAQTSSAVSNQTDADETFHFIYATLDKNA